MGERFKSNLEVYRGREFEEDTFPSVLTAARLGSNKHVSYKESIENPAAWELVKANQPWDPGDPRLPHLQGRPERDAYARFANDLHASIADRLELEDYSNLKLYTALGSAIDRHGVDAFAEWQGARVTFDLTVNPEKRQYKADFILEEPLVEDEVLRDSKVQEIVELLQSRQAEAKQLRETGSKRPLGSSGLTELHRRRRQQRLLK